MNNDLCYLCSCVLDGIYHEHDDELFCDDCFYDTFDTCCHCCATVHIDDGGWHDFCDDFICDDCNSSEVVTCDNCNSETWRGNSYNDRNITWCETCYHDQPCCANCGAILTPSEERFGSYCENCEDDDDDDINSWCYRPPVNFYGTTQKQGGYGLELEIDGARQNTACSKELNGLGLPIYFKEDGSLKTGFEIVTHVGSLAYHETSMDWPAICETAQRHGYRSHDTDTCGLHIHASRELFGAEGFEQLYTAAKVLMIIERHYEGNLLKFSRRSLDKMAHWSKKNGANITADDDELEAVYKLNQVNRDRYTAMNLTNDDTIEFRFFRGTLKADTIIAAIQWVDTLISFCRTHALDEVYSASWSHIFDHTEHKELNGYLQQRGLK